MVNEKALLSVIELLSVTRAVKLNGLPTLVVGVPERTPPLDSDNPVGTLPAETLQTKGAAPPEAAMVCE
jgi:hypothetical protein